MVLILMKDYFIEALENVLTNHPMSGEISTNGIILRFDNTVYFFRIIYECKHIKISNYTPWQFKHFLSQYGYICLNWKM